MPHSNRNEGHSPGLSHLAIASVVLGILGFATLWILGGLLLAGAGAVLGHLALHDIRMSKGLHSGRRLAQVGLVISYLAMAVFPLILIGSIASLPALKGYQRSQGAAKSESSRMQASKLFMACEDYSRANRGRYPKSWDELSGQILSPVELASLLESPHPEASSEPAFKLVPHERPILAAVASSVVVIQETAPPEVEKVAIVYGNGEVDLIENPDRF
ncbi:MAG: DUF4190 domain-containing protein [Verrucomicrobiales bacterium]|nr:DUF4190 domain-containing protein [Verrucomicrobiales bacterium]